MEDDLQPMELKQEASQLEIEKVTIEASEERICQPGVPCGPSCPMCQP